MSLDFVIRGNIIYSKTISELSINDSSYLVCKNGLSAGVFESLPPEYSELPLFDFGDSLVIPGMSDLHLHASQYAYRGTGMDMELLDWLNSYAFPEEHRFEEPEYAEKAYDIFVSDLVKSPTTRACIFATIHTPATLLLMEKLEKSGLISFVGKVNMDRNSPSYLCEETQKSLEDTELWLKAAESFSAARPILTPRFTPSCSDTLMEGLGRLQKKYGLPVQSHLSENYSEIEWVKELCPSTRDYGESYERYGLFGGGAPTIMAHCVHCPDSELNRIKQAGVFIAHCPQSNTNIASGIAPVRRFLSEGISVGLGTDVAGGANLSLFRSMADAVQVSKLRWRLVDDSLPALTLPEAFYMATLGGGSFFGKVGSFAQGYELDAVVLDDTSLAAARPLSSRERLERLTYLGGEQIVKAKFVFGKRIF